MSENVIQKNFIINFIFLIFGKCELLYNIFFLMIIIIIINNINIMKFIIKDVFILIQYIFIKIKL